MERIVASSRGLRELARAATCWPSNHRMRGGIQMTGHRFVPRSRAGSAVEERWSDRASGCRSRARSAMVQQSGLVGLGSRSPVPMGQTKQERVIIATTDPQTLPDLTTFYLVTNLPAPDRLELPSSAFAAASLEEVVRLYGLRMWVEQSYKHVKHALGWSQYQVRSDQAMRRHWQLVCCAFSFCWYHASHPSCEPDTRDQGAF